ncbi:MAG TPA: CARDB domain-containing protein, partial [Thermoplasmata archaeon]|nr:CARDB domain-containing protein [Thermoplasmata archaeon]
KAYLHGADLTKASPDPAHPFTSVSNGTGPFTINITAPNKDQVITLIVEVGSAAAGRHENTTVSKAITVVTPILLTATFRNDGGAAALDVPVKFFIDGKVAGATNISRIDPGQTGTAKLSYLPVGLAVGGHTVRVEADLNRNGVIEPDKGEVAVVDLFYKKDFELTWPYAALIMGATLSVSYVVIRARRRRR